MNLALARVQAIRLARTPRSWLPAIGWALVAVLSAAVARRSGGSSGADHVMRGAFGYLALPLLGYAVVGATFGERGLRGSIRGLVALGARPRDAALATTAVAVVASAAVCAALGAVVCVLAHGDLDPPLGQDLPASLWVSALAGATYAAYFSAGAALGRGAMRGVLLAADWILGASAGAGALLVPRGHVTALLGGPRCADLPLRASSVALLVLLTAYAAGAVALARRRA